MLVLYDDTMTTREKVIDLTDKGLNPRQIAALLSISTQMVYKHMKNAGIPTRRARRES